MSSVVNIPELLYSLMISLFGEISSDNDSAGKCFSRTQTIHLWMEEGLSLHIYHQALALITYCICMALLYMYGTVHELHVHFYT